MRFAILFLCVALAVQLTGQTLSIGAAGVYGDDVGVPGFNVRGYFNTKSHQQCVGPEFTWFRATELHDGVEVDKRLFEFNFNGHYVFELFEGFGINPITGLNYSREVEEGGLENDHHEVSAWGWNVGAGFHYFVGGNVLIIGEWDHLVSKLSQNTFTLGVLYSIRLGKGGHDEHHGD